MKPPGRGGLQTGQVRGFTHYWRTEAVGSSFLQMAQRTRSPQRSKAMRLRWAQFGQVTIAPRSSSSRTISILYLRWRAIARLPVGALPRDRECDGCRGALKPIAQEADRQG